MRRVRQYTDVALYRRLIAERASWEAKEHEALRSGEAARARHCRAMVERMTRQLTRLAALQNQASPDPVPDPVAR